MARELFLHADVCTGALSGKLGSNGSEFVLKAAQGEMEVWDPILRVWRILSFGEATLSFSSVQLSDVQVDPDPEYKR